MSELVQFYWRLALRRLPMLIGLVALFGIVSVAYAINQPNRFEASARLLVEPPQIPDELAASTVNTGAAEELQIIQERVLSRANLLEIANKFDVFPETRPELSPDEVLELMNAATTINTPRARRDQANFVDISFSAGDPQVAAAVVNEYVTRMLDENIRMRTRRAGNTLDFFEQEVERLSEELAVQSGRISTFKAENSTTLPESLNYRLSRESALEERLLSLNRELTSLEEQRERVTAVFQETGSLRTPEADLTPEQRQLRDLESELSSALALYSESNPRVTVLRTRIEQLRKVVNGQAADGTSSSEGPSVYEVTLAEIDARASSLNGEIAGVENELENLRSMIQKTPQTAIALESLQRVYQNVQQQYDGAVSRLARARTGQQIELTAQGQRITVVENATPPEWPTSPNRKLIVAAGGLAGVGAAAGLFALLEILNSSIRRPAELVSRVGITPIATIPYIRTRRQEVTRRTLQVSVLLLFFIVAPAVIYAVHQYVMPLPELAESAKEFIKSLAV